MPINLPDTAPVRARMSARAAEGRKSWQHRVRTFIDDHYAANNAPLALEDIRAALSGKTNVIKNAVAALILDGHVRVVGWSVDAERRDLGATAKMYALPVRRCWRLTWRGMTALPPRSRPPPAADRRYLLNTDPPRGYVGKPQSLRPARVKAEPYRGEIGQKYIAPVTNSGTGRRPEDFYGHRDLAMLARS